MSSESVEMDDMSPQEAQAFTAFCDELGQVGQRHDLDSKRLVQGFLYFGVKLADEFDLQYEIGGTEVTVRDE